MRPDPLDAVLATLNPLAQALARPLDHYCPADVVDAIPVILTDLLVLRAAFAWAFDQYSALSHRPPPPSGYAVTVMAPGFEETTYVGQLPLEVYLPWRMLRDAARRALDEAR